MSYTFGKIEGHIYVDSMADREHRPFANAVKAGAAATMSSYNQINNSYSSQNSWTLNHLLKNELGYQGLVMTDWGGHHSGVSSALAGLDMDMPGDIDPLSGASYWGANLTIAVANGTLPQWRLDDMCMRIMASWYKVGRDKIDIPVNYNSYTTSEYGPIYPYIEESPIERINENVYVRGSHKQIIREIGRASNVLLKNKGALPLTGIRQHLGLFGSDAGSNPYGANGCPYRACDNGTLAEGWGSGSYSYPYLVTPEQAITDYVVEKTQGSVFTITENFSADDQIEVFASQIDTAIVFVNSNSGEGVRTFAGNYGDRNNISLWLGGDDLIKKVAGICNNTIVVMHTVGPVIVTDWYENENITAILWAGLPGQESGNALVDVLWGDYNPSGKLPFTFGKTRESYGRSVLYEPNNGRDAPQQWLTSMNIDYRHFDASDLEPIYEFGFGLSYTTFEYTDLKITALDAAPYKASSEMTQPAPTFGNITLGHYVSTAWTSSCTCLILTASIGPITLPTRHPTVPGLHLSLPHKRGPKECLGRRQLRSSAILVAPARLQQRLSPTRPARWRRYRRQSRFVGAVIQSLSDHYEHGRTCRP